MSEHSRPDRPVATVRLKSLAKRLARPAAAVLLARVDARVTPRFEAVEASLTGLRADVATVVELVQSVQRRNEFIRKEIILEVRYAKGGEAVDRAASFGVVNAEKLKAMKNDLRLNLGAGHIALPGYLNVDSRPLDHIDIVAEVRELPFEPGQLSEIFSAHFLEHFPREELRRVLLPYWVSLLKEGGLFVAVVPDIDTMITEYVAGRMTFAEFSGVTFGGQEYDGDFHYSCFSQESLAGMLEEAGLTAVKVREFARRNGTCYEMEIEGTAWALGGKARTK